MRGYQLTHVTRYSYSMPVAVSRHAGYLRPRVTPRQVVEHYALTISPPPTEKLERVDYFGNTQVQFQIEERHEELRVTAESLVCVDTEVSPFPEAPVTCEEVRRQLGADSGRETLHACLMASPSSFTKCGETLGAFAGEFLVPGRPYLEAAIALNTAIHENIEFDPEATDVSTPADEVFLHRRGVCQDFAHLMLACLRSRRLPARYVSGYILTHPPEGQPRLQGADASHAWVSVWIPGQGWIDLDPTNNMSCRDEHITVACGRDYADVNPLRGAVTGGGEQQIHVAVTMMPVDPPPWCQPEPGLPT